MLTWLLNWLQDIPVASVLREKLNLLEAQAKQTEVEYKKKETEADKEEAEKEKAHAGEVAGLKEQIAQANARTQAAEVCAKTADAVAENLKLQLRNAQAQVERLKQELVNNELQKRHLEPEAETILVKMSSRAANYRQTLQNEMGLSVTKFDYLFERLNIEFKLIYREHGQQYYMLTQAGRAYLLRNKLIT